MPPVKAHLPEDPSAKIPAAVRRAGAAADELHKQVYTPEPEPPAEPPQEPPAPPAEPSAPPAEPPATPPQQTVVPETAPNELDSWERRYGQMHGRFKQSLNTISTLNGRVQELERLLAARPTTPAPTPDTSTPQMSDEDRQTWGEDMLGVIGRQAKAAMKAELDARDREIAELKAQVGGVSTSLSNDARNNMLQRMDAELPNWKLQNENPEFLNWLALPDPYSGANRGKLLEQAFGQNDTHRVLAFFKGFLSEEAALAPPAPTPPAPSSKVPLETFAAPGRARTSAAAPSSSAEKPIITRAQVAQFYADVASGRYHGQDAKKASDEAMIFAAQQEGRIR